MSRTLRMPLCLLVVACLLLGLAACGTPSSPATPTPTQSDGAAATPAPTQAEDPAGLAPLTIQWVGPEYGPAAEDAVVIQEIEERFNVTIEDIYIEAAQKVELLNLRFASDNIPDIWPAGTNMTAYREWVRQDILLPIGREEALTLAPTIASEIDGWEAELGDNIWDFVKVDGQSYALPQMNVDSTYFGPTIWRNDWLANVGIDKIPETIEEFEAALYAFANDDPDGNGKKDTFGVSQNGLASIYGVSGYWHSYWQLRDGQVVWGGIQPEMKEVLAMLAQWYQDGVIDPEFSTGENQGGYWAISHSFVNGKIGMTGMGSWYHWNYPYFEGAAGGSNYPEFMSLQQGGSYTFGTPAVGANGKSGRAVGQIAVGATCFGYKLEDKPETLERIMLILDTVASDRDLYIFVKYGVEGEHYNMINGEPSIIEGVDQSTIGASNLFTPWQSMRQYQSLRPTNYEFANQVVGGDIPKYKNAVPQSLSSDPDYKSDLEAFQNETYYSIINGTKPVDYFDTFATEWLARGGSVLTQEANEWYAAHN